MIKGIFKLHDYQSGHTTMSPPEAHWSQISIPTLARWELLLFNKQLIHWVLGLYLGNAGLLSEKKIKHACFEVANWKDPYCCCFLKNKYNWLWMSALDIQFRLLYLDEILVVVSNKVRCQQGKISCYWVYFWHRSAQTLVTLSAHYLSTSNTRCDCANHVIMLLSIYAL